MSNIHIWFWGFMAVLILLIILGMKLKNMNNDMINDLIDNKINQYPPYPQIDIRYDVTDKEGPIEHLMEYPYRIMGTCNKIDYISQRFRGWPTPFQIDRFRHHCIYEYEKSGKSKVIPLFTVYDRNKYTISYNVILSSFLTQNLVLILNCIYIFKSSTPSSF